MILINSLIFIFSLLVMMVVTVLIAWPMLLFIGKYCKWCYEKIIGDDEYEEYEEYDDRRY